MASNLQIFGHDGYVHDWSGYHSGNQSAPICHAVHCQLQKLTHNYCVGAAVCLRHAALPGDTARHRSGESTEPGACNCVKPVALGNFAPGLIKHRVQLTCFVNQLVQRQ